jgi:transposase-like protein
MDSIRSKQMISMYTKQEIIIDSFRQGKSQRTIARDLQINRKTVKKYILEHEALLLQSVCSKEAAQSIALSDKPAYNMTVPHQKEEINPALQSLIDEFGLEEV